MAGGGCFGQTATAQASRSLSSTLGHVHHRRHARGHRSANFTADEKPLRYEFGPSVVCNQLIEPPRAGDALQFVLPGLCVAEAGADREVLDCL